MSAFHLTLLGLTQGVSLDAFLRASDASPWMRSIFFDHTIMDGSDHVAYWLFNNTSFPSTKHWQNTRFFLREANEIYLILYLVSVVDPGWQITKTCVERSLLSRFAMIWRWSCISNQGPGLGVLHNPLTLSGTQIHPSSSTLTRFLSKSFLPHFTEKTDNIWVLAATTQRALW